MNKFILIILVIFHSNKSFAQQSIDTTFQIDTHNPRYSAKNSPTIFIDAMHNNLHKENSNFAPFAMLARNDGYKVKSLTQWQNLDQANLLVISNAINDKNIGNWERPIFSAFDDAEIERIVNFVNSGGSLLLIADHMPFAGAASVLAKEFGFDFCDGFANFSNADHQPDAFSKSNLRLQDNIITDGTMGKEVSTVITFTGSSFDIPKKAIGILKFLDQDVCLLPDVAWDFNDSTPQENLDGKFQGAILQFGKGKVAVFGEAAMFTAQTISQNGNDFKVGFNAPHAGENIVFIQNLLFWLTKDTITEDAIYNLEKDILSVNRQMEYVFNNQKFSNVSQFYTSDAVVVGGNNTEIIGKNNLTDYWSKFSGDLRWEIQNTSIKSLGENSALQRGFSNIYFKNEDGTESVSKSIFSIVWIKKNNEWKIMLDHFSRR